MLDKSIVISKLDLTAGEKKELREIIQIIPPSEEESFYSLLNQKPELAKRLLDNYRRKKEIIANQDKQAWKKLLQEEQGLVKELATEE